MQLEFPFFHFLVMQLQFQKFQNYFVMQLQFFFPELILQKYSVEGYVASALVVFKCHTSDSD